MFFLCHNPECRSGRHWTARAADACYAEVVNTVQTDAPAYDPAAESERLWHKRTEAARLKKLATRLADYTPEPPSRRPRPTHKGRYSLARDEILVEDADYGQAPDAARRRVPGGWRIIALRAAREGV